MISRKASQMMATAGKNIIGKTFFGAQLPIIYYRCTSKNCSAKKQVQRSNEDATMLIITYRGRHMCMQGSSSNPQLSSSSSDRTNVSLTSQADFKSCQVLNCTKLAEGLSCLCIFRGGGHQFLEPGCTKGAKESTMFCKVHCKWRNCKVEGCAEIAEGSIDYCRAHGGGNWCTWSQQGFDSSSRCDKFASRKSGLSDVPVKSVSGADQQQMVAEPEEMDITNVISENQTAQMMSEGSDIEMMSDFEEIEMVTESVEDSQVKQSEIVQIQEMLGTTDLSGEFSLEAALQNGMIKLTDGKHGMKSDRTLRQIVECIKKSDIVKLGIYGRAGVGKTTVLEALREEPAVKEMFDSVIWVTVPENWSVKEAQMAIEGQISFSEIDNNEQNKSQRLSSTLKGLKFLLILDNVGEYISLEMMGIPEPSSENGSKIVLTARSEELCDLMQVDLKIRLEDLLSWDLFCQNMGQVVNSSSIEPIAKQTVLMCNHYVHAIILMARALKDVSDICVWNSALEGLSLQPACDRGKLENLMVNVLKFILEQLEEDKFRKCLKSCAMLIGNEEIATKTLVGCWIRDGLIDEPHKGYEIIKSLCDADLLESTESEYFVKLHNVDRYILLNFIYQPEEGRQFIMRGGLGLTEPPKIEEWECVTEIHLMDNELSQLPENPRCPTLSTLFLQRNYKLRKIPPSFFQHMPTLQVLNLSRTRMKSLPESLYKLISLKRLFLNQCDLLTRISPKIGELKHLEVLDVGGTEIMDLPNEVKHLVNLKCLEVSFSGYMNHGGRSQQLMTIIPCGIISALSQVEELNIDVYPDDERWDLCVESVLGEVCSLKMLSALNFYFPRVELFRNFIWNDATMFSPLLSHFRFIVGQHAQRIMNRLPCDVEFELERWDKCLKYVNGVGIPAELRKVLRHTTAFFLDRHTTVKKLSSFGIDNMQQLKCCVIGECNELQVIIDGEGIHKEGSSGREIISQSLGNKFDVLESLEYLYIYRMKNLRSLWEGPVLVWGKCFALLKSLTLRTCPQLTSIFAQALLDNLMNLEELTVEDCPAITSLVSCQNPPNQEASHFLPRLRKMSLHYLPELVSIFNGLPIAQQLAWLSVYGCPNLLSLPIDHVSSNQLRMIKGELSWWEALEWRTKRSAHLDGIFVPINI